MAIKNIMLPIMWQPNVFGHYTYGN